MKKLITIIFIVLAFMLGYAAGNNTVEDVTASDDGVQITYTDGTGYWFEY